MNYPALDVKGKVAVVTGAGRGLGEGFALALGHYGADVVLASRTVSELEKTAASIQGMGRRTLVVHTDVTRKANVEQLVERALERFGKIDVLVNNAGFGSRRDAVDIAEEEWDLTMQTNLKGQFLVGQAVGKAMIRQGWGKIINVTSVLGHMCLPGTSMYGVSKAGVIQMTRAWAVEWAKQGVTVNAIAPAYVRTSMNAATLDKEEKKREILGHVPLGRIATVDDLAGPIVFLASGASDYVNGHVLYVDGGWCTL